MVTCSRWLTKTYKSNGLFQKKSEQVKGLIKKEVEFPGVFTKKSCGVSIGLCLWPCWNFHQRGVTQFCKIRRVESFLSQCKMTNLKIRGFFFSEKNIYHQPCLDFFWNSPILMKGGRKCLACNVPYQATKIRLV